MSRETTQHKAERLLAEGRVGKPDLAYVFPVQGDNGSYQVTIARDLQACTCPSETTCSHIRACAEWVHRDAEQIAEEQMPKRRPFVQEEFDAFCADPKRQALVERILREIDG